MAPKPRRKPRDPLGSLRPGPPVPSPSALQAAYADLVARPNVQGCYVGQKSRGGRRTAEPALVCVVSEKVARADLHPRRELLPRTVSWPSGTRARGRIQTDVQTLSGRFVPAASVAGPGDAVVKPGGTPGVSPRATAGLAVMHPTYGPLITTAGHLVLAPPMTGTVVWPPEARPLVRVSAGPGADVPCLVLKATCTDIADYALLAPRPPLACQNLYRDTHPVAPPYLPSPADLGAPLLVLSAAGAKRTTFRGIHGFLPAGNAGMMRGLIVTDFATAPGDSGACLIDVKGRVWGLLVGFSILEGRPCSVFIVAELLLALEKAAFL
jgi:hypothetical protein